MAKNLLLEITLLSVLCGTMPFVIYIYHPALLQSAHEIFFEIAKGNIAYPNGMTIRLFEPITWFGRDAFMAFWVAVPYLFFPAFFFVGFGRKDLAFLFLLVPFSYSAVTTITQLVFTIFFFMMVLCLEKNNALWWVFGLLAVTSHAYAWLFVGVYLLLRFTNMNNGRFLIYAFIVFPLVIAALNITFWGIRQDLKDNFFTLSKSADIFTYALITFPLAFAYFTSKKSGFGVYVLALMLFGAIPIAMSYHEIDPLLRLVGEFDAVVLLFMAAQGIRLDLPQTLTLAGMGLLKIALFMLIGASKFIWLHTAFPFI